MNLAVGLPFLYFLFACYRGYCLVIDLEPDELVHAVSFRKALNRFGPVLISAPHDIVCHAEIERAVFFTRKEIDVVRHRGHRGLWIPGPRQEARPALTNARMRYPPT